MWSGFHRAKAGEKPVKANATAKSHGRKAGGAECFFKVRSVPLSSAKDGIGIMLRWALAAGIPINPFGARMPPSGEVVGSGANFKKGSMRGFGSFGRNGVTCLPNGAK